jgi:hypothetical protein
MLNLFLFDVIAEFENGQGIILKFSLLICMLLNMR